MHSGLSVTGMQKFMANLEVPPVSAITLKKRKIEIRAAMEKVVKKSCAANMEGVVNLKASYEWVSRGKVAAENIIVDQGLVF